MRENAFSQGVSRGGRSHLVGDSATRDRAEPPQFQAVRAEGSGSTPDQAAPSGTDSATDSATSSPVVGPLTGELWALDWFERVLLEQGEP